MGYTPFSRCPISIEYPGSVVLTLSLLREVININHLWFHLPGLVWFFQCVTYKNLTNIKLCVESYFWFYVFLFSSVLPMPSACPTSKWLNMWNKHRQPENLRSRWLPNCCAVVWPANRCSASRINMRTRVLLSRVPKLPHRCASVRLLWENPTRLPNWMTRKRLLMRDLKASPPLRLPAYRFSVIICSRTVISPLNLVWIWLLRQIIGWGPVTRWS